MNTQYYYKSGDYEMSTMLLTLTDTEWSYIRETNKIAVFIKENGVKYMSLYDCTGIDETEYSVPFEI